MIPVVTRLVLCVLLCLGDAEFVQGCKDQVPPGCVCQPLTGRSKGNVQIICRGNGFTTIPTGLPKNTRDLRLPGNDVKSISAETFKNLKHLEKLTLDGSALTSLDFAMFLDVKNLETLNLDRNKISSIANSAGTRTLRKLDSLNLSGNQISSIDFSVFEGMLKLKELKLSNSGIESITTSRRRLQFKSLALLMLDGNKLVRLESFSLPGFEQTVSVNFKGNQISRIAGDAFGKMKKESRISLEGNQLKCACMRRFRAWANKYSVTLHNAVCMEDGIELDKRDTFPACRGEVFQCYKCEDASEPGTGQCTTLVDCDQGQDQCLSVSDPSRSLFYHKGCRTTEECQDSRSEESGDAECCAETRCNRGRKFTTPPSKIYCKTSLNRNIKGGFHWPETKVGEQAEVACPGDRRQTATRPCILKTDDKEAVWGRQVDDRCPDASDITEELAILLDTHITDDNLGNLSSRLMFISERCPEYSDMDVDHTVNILVRLLRHPAKRSEREATADWTSTLNNMFASPENSIITAEQNYNSARRFVKTVDELGARIDLDEPGQTVTEVRPNLAVVAVSVNPANPGAITIQAEPTFTGTDSVASRDVQAVGDGGVQQDTITLPGSIFQRGDGIVKPDRATFVLYQKDTFFKAIEAANNQPVAKRNNSQTAQVNSRILAASIGSRNIVNLREPVLLSFRHRRQNASQPQCVFWDFANSSWSGKGCVVKETVPDSYTVCQCDHLTNFALLMDVYGTGQTQPSQATEILTVVSFVGCVISFFCLLLTIIIYCLFSKLLKDIPSKILLNLCVALACLNVTFVVSMYSLDNPDLCKAIAVLIHYFLLSSMAWMSVEAVYMYLALVLVFRTYVHRFMVKSMLAAWGIPLVIVAVTLGINETNNYGIQTNNKICWLTRTAFYVTALAPVCVVLLGNCIIFALVIKQICGMSSKKLNKSDTVTATQQLRGIVGVFILLGLSWIFAFFAIGEASIVFQYLFTLFNSLQGLFIFVFYCLMKRDVQKRLFCCCPAAFDPSTSSHRSSKGTYSTSDRVKVRLRAAVQAVISSNAIKRDSNGSISFDTDGKVRSTFL